MTEVEVITPTPTPTPTRLPKNQDKAMCLIAQLRNFIGK